ncbi:MAG: DUF748 domain-containing protein [Pseudomonadota bacterium]
MLAKLRAWLVKTPVKVALGLVVTYLLFGWFGFEPLVKWLAPKIVADKSRHHLVIDAAKFDPLALSLRVRGLKLTEPDGKPLLAFDELFVDFETASLFKWAYTFETVRLVAPRANVALLADGQLNWSALIEAFKSEEDEPDQPLPRLLVRHFALEKGRVDLADRRVGFETGLDPIDLRLDELSTLPDDKGAYSLAATTRLGARIRWQGELGLTPTVATGRLGIDQVRLSRIWPYFKDRLNMAPPQGQAELSLDYRVSWIDKRLSLVVDKINAQLRQLVLSGKAAKEPAVRLDKLALRDGRFDLDKRSLEIGGIALEGGQIQLNRDRAGRLNVQDWVKPLPLEGGGVGERVGPLSDQKTQRPTLSRPAGTLPPQGRGDGEPWRIKLASFGLDGLAIRLRDAGFRQPLDARLGRVKIDLKAQAEVGGAQTRALVDGVNVTLADLSLASGEGGKPFFTLAGIELADGRVDLAEQAATLRAVTFTGGGLEVVRDRQGRLALLEVLQPVARPAVGKPEGKEGPQSGWRYRIDDVGLAGFRVDVRDEGVQPAVRLGLERIDASVKGVSQDLKQSLPVRLSLRVKQGGAFQADGRVTPAKAAADLRLRLSGLDLRPAQPYVGQAANLVLASGTASAQGRLRLDGKPRFEGGFQVADLLLSESESGERFLAWKRLSSDSVSYRPEALDIDELRLDGLGAKLVIYADKTVNLKRILKSEGTKRGGEAAAATLSPTPLPSRERGSQNLASSTETPPPPRGGRVAPTQTATRMTIDRIRVENGELDFADLSLALPFATRIHHFKGAFNGISTQPGSAAQLELDGQVDDHGLARAVGQLDLFDPTGFMDIKVVFRNVEMTRLTPYTATFVGRKIQSGKLSLDLEYKLKQRQLLGENQIVMDKLTLGERVQSPTAKDLPLDLAIAILQDGDGRIDLGLPVSGSLDDPEFSYGRIIWKAIGNIITKIVTAPFRALASLFGGDGEKLERIAFEAGEAGLTPPEREKFKQIATVLGKRPGLALTVHPAWSAELDRPAMKEARLRRAVAERMGLKLAQDEEPGPISTASPKAQAALEALYAARFGDEAWRTLRAQWRQANPGKQPEGAAGRLMSRLQGLLKKQEPLSEAELARLKDADLHALLYARLLERVEVADADLAALARSRGEAIARGLAAAGAPAARVRVDVAEGVANGAAAGTQAVVPVRLELGVAR